MQTHHNCTTDQITHLQLGISRKLPGPHGAENKPKTARWRPPTRVNLSFHNWHTRKGMFCHTTPAVLKCWPTTTTTVTPLHDNFPNHVGFSASQITIHNPRRLQQIVKQNTTESKCWPKPFKKRRTVVWGEGWARNRDETCSEEHSHPFVGAKKVKLSIARPNSESHLSIWFWWEPNAQSHLFGVKSQNLVAPFD